MTDVHYRDANGVNSTPVSEAVPLPVKFGTGTNSATLNTGQVTVPSTEDGILLLAANADRKGAVISNPGSVAVYIGAQATGLSTGNGFALPPGAALNIDANPLYTGAIHGIVASGTQVVTVAEFT